MVILFVAKCPLEAVNCLIVTLQHEERIPVLEVALVHQVNIMRIRKHFLQLSCFSFGQFEAFLTLINFLLSIDAKN